jgi:hypothetical protein
MGLDKNLRALLSENALLQSPTNERRSMLSAFIALLIKLLNTPANVQALVGLLTKMLKSLPA